MKALRGSVGRGGNNYKKEVVRIQATLNLLPESLGGPAVPLKLDDIVGPKTIAAIERFQMVQFQKKDGRVDPGGPTVKKLAELEGSDQVLPLVLFPAAAEKAGKWLEAGLWTVNQALGPNRTVKPKNQVSDDVQSMFIQFFALVWDPVYDSGGFQRQVTGADLQFMKEKVMKMIAALKMAPTFIQLEYDEMYFDLTQPRAIAPCSGGRGGAYPHFTWCDTDAVNQIGADINVRASLLLQASAAAGDPPDRSVGVISFDWATSGMVMADLALHLSDCYLFFCQQAAGSPMYYFMRSDGGKFTPQARPMRQ